MAQSNLFFYKAFIQTRLHIRSFQQRAVPLADSTSLIEARRKTRRRFDFLNYGVRMKTERVFGLRRESFFASFRVTWRGLCVWVTLPRLTLLSVEPGRKAGRRFDSSPFRHSLIRIETTSPEIARGQCL
jgi:hypothetical protein